MRPLGSEGALRSMEVRRETHGILTDGAMGELGMPRGLGGREGLRRDHGQS